MPDQIVIAPAARGFSAGDGWPRLARVGVGAVAGAYLLGLSTIRLGPFHLRDEPAVLFGLKTAQLLGLAIAVFAVLLLIGARRTGVAAVARLEASRP